MRMSRRMGLLGGGGPLWLFDGTKGGDVTKNSGGWTGLGTSGSGGSSSCTETEIRITVSRSTSSDKGAAAQTVNYINFDKLTTLYFHVSSYVAPNDRRMGVLQSGSVSSYVASVAPTGTGWYSVDVSSVTGSYQVGFHVKANKNGTSGHLYVDKVYAE